VLLIKLKLGLSRIDDVFEGGLNKGELTLFCGEPGSGKTALALQLALKSCLDGFKVLYVYTDGLFPYPRVEALARRRGMSLDILSSKFYVTHLINLNDLAEVVRGLELGRLNHDLVIFDTFTAPYRSLKVENRREIVLHNKKLNQVAAILKSYVIGFKRWAVLTSRLKSPPTGEEVFDELVASNILTYWSDNIISMSKASLPQQREMSLLKIHGRESKVELVARVVDGFLEEVN
jgi:RecA/RadA recombinase